MIDVENVTVRFGDVTAVESVSLTVEPGEFVRPIGPNGVGKTTLLGAIAGIVAPDTGAVSIDGDAAASLGTRERTRRVAVVPQETRLSFYFSVRDVVAMGRTPYEPRFGVGRKLMPSK